MNHDSPAEIRAFLEQQGLSLKKRWGQNFLVNRGARERLVGLLDIAAGEPAWEIGPGLGSMTGLLLEAGALLTVFEVDRGLCRWLESEYGGRTGFSLVPGDFLETWRAQRASHGAPTVVVGNLPYRSASIMIAALVEGELRPRRLVFTVQKELAQRMAALPGQKAYSSFTVLCQSCFDVEGRGDLKPGSFFPVPEVSSSIVVMTPRSDAPVGASLDMLSRLARGLFASRRKTIRNNAAAAAATHADLPADRVLAALEGAGYGPGRRAEEVPPEAWCAVARKLTGS